MGTTTGISEAVQLSGKPGSQRKLAKLLGVSQQVVSDWVARGWVPQDRAIEIEARLGVPRKRLLNPKIVELLAN